MSDTNETARQATHAKQEGVDDNVAALSGPVVDSGTSATDGGATIGAAKRSWSTAVNAARSAVGAASDAGAAKDGPAISGRWVAAASMGIGSAALVAALLYANRSRDKGAKAAKPDKPRDKDKDED